MYDVLKSVIQAVYAQKNILVIALVLGNLLFNIVANVSFKYSAESYNVRGFLIWQVFGNLAGFITVLALTGLLRFIPLHIAYPVTTGLAVIGVEAVAGKLLGETVSTGHWLGAILIVAGVVLLSQR